MAQEKIVISVSTTGIRTVKRDLTDIGVAGDKVGKSTKGMNDNFVKMGRSSGGIRTVGRDMAMLGTRRGARLRCRRSIRL